MGTGGAAGVEFTVCERVEPLGGDDQVSPAAFVLVLALGDLRRAVLGERVVLNEGNDRTVRGQNSRQLGQGATLA